MTFAGFPTTIVQGSTSLATTAPAPPVGVGVRDGATGACATAGTGVGEGAGGSDDSGVEGAAGPCGLPGDEVDATVRAGTTLQPHGRGALCKPFAAQS